MSLSNSRAAVEDAVKNTMLFVLAFVAATVGLVVEARGMNIAAYSWFVGAGLLAGWWFRSNMADEDDDDDLP